MEHSAQRCHHRVQDLPDHIRVDPHFIAWRVQAVEERVAALEEHQHVRIRTPMGELPLPIALLVALGLMAYKPELVVKFLGL